ncbi:MAG: response regulator transcription factor [Microbacteriaceae bacterium]|nr:response regulator transcription factor [Microbacteriaceae bacterium]
MGVAQSFLTEIKLTNREKDVLKALMRDLTLQEIAEELFISPNTVKTTRSSLYRKLEASNKSEAITTALSHGII